MIYKKDYLKNKTMFNETKLKSKIDSYLLAKLTDYIKSKFSSKYYYKEFMQFIRFLFYSEMLLGFHNIKIYYNNIICYDNNPTIRLKLTMENYILIIAYVYYMLNNYNSSYNQHLTIYTFLKYIDDIVRSLNDSNIRKLRRFYVKELLNQKG